MNSRRVDPVQDYWQDAWQRSILMLDVLRQRGNIYREHNAESVPHVLDFEAELVRDGRTLEHPVNYGLVRIVPPKGVKIAADKRPFIVVDPRAGHGPGIGGMKQESEIGQVLEAGHPCYFVGFLPESAPGQTIEHVWQAQAQFVEDVASRHPDAEGKPAVIANCQAGWQTMIMAATSPDVAGPIMLAGAPLSYWAGVRGKNPMRYSGGILGGTWMTALAGDLGGGTFDGANLVANFESLNPANTYWEKPYNVYSRIDTEAERFLDFETWWGSPITLNAEEMQWIADSLFVGNKLVAGELRTSDGVRIDLRNVKSPIIVFCSWGDDITPPQQALGWIPDLYDDDRQIVANGQTIVYSLHQSIGHLGIFVSGKVASKEHDEFTDCMDLIDLMPPGLYEAVITEVDEDTANPALIEGRYLFRLEPRSLDDIRAIVANNPEDDRRFVTAARVSEINLALYRTLVAPMVRALSTSESARALQKMHPNRLRFDMFSNENPMMRMFEALAENTRRERRPVAPDNPLLAMENAMSSWISTSLNLFGSVRDAMVEKTFLEVYGSPLLQAMVGLGEGDKSDARHATRDLAREAAEAQLSAELEGRFETGGAVEAALRSFIYVRLAEGAGGDERGLAILKAYRSSQAPGSRRTMAQLKQLLKEQFLILRLDEERAVAAIPRLLPRNQEQRQQVLQGLRRMVEVHGPLSEEAGLRLARIEALFDIKSQTSQKEGVNA